MEFISYELDWRTIVFVILLAWLVHMAINKLVQTLRKGDPNPVRKDDPAELSCASSSNESRPPKHDVFLSFRGPDTRKGITNDLYVELQNKRIRTYRDTNDLEVGSKISPSLLTAIEESTFAIVVLSLNYATSTWCLEELTKIVQCMYDKDRVLPLFYNVDPSDVRYQKNSYEVAFKDHKKKSRHDTVKLNQWRDALKKVADLSGWDSRCFKTDRELVKEIVQNVYTRVRPTDHEWAMSTEDFEAFRSTKEAMNEVMKALKNAEVGVVGVYGMGGVGKTTLVKHVGEQARKIGIFRHVIIVVISQNPDLRKIQGTLADLLHVNLEGETEIGRADELYKEIMSKNNLLIILDDIWNMVELSSIGIPNYDKLKTCNSKVLLTTRGLQVCHIMKCQSIISLNILSEEDSLKLFMKKTGKSFGEKSSRFYEVARNVTRECCGLPIALIAVARALEDKDLEEWEKAVQRLAKSQLAIPDDERVAFKCIQLSYDYLKDDDCKSCFLFCCLFPEDYNIPVKYLLTYGLGKGLFRDADTFMEAKGDVESVVKHLKCSSLLMDGENSGFIKMHDVIRDTAIQIAKDWLLVRAGLNLKDWPRRLHEGYSVVSLMWNYIDHLPTQISFPELEILLLRHNDFRAIPETFFESLNGLKVLDLSETGISELPKSSSLLTNLRALYLNGCQFLVDISVVGKLEKLEILSMQSYRPEEFPREIGDLANLRTLDITGARIIRIPSKVISKLHNLEELYLTEVFWKWGSSVEGQEPNASFEEVLSLSNLRVLQVCISDTECIPKTIETEPNWVEFAITIGRGAPELFTYLSPRRMVEIHRASTLPDWFFRAVIYKAERLSWKNNLKLADILVEYEHGKFHGLKYLSINRRNSSEVSIPMGSGDGNQSFNWDSRKELRKEPLLENLEELHLHQLLPGEELCLDELPPRSLLNLKVFRVSSCNEWGNVVFPAKLLNRSPNLEKLTGSLMNRVNYVFGCQDYLLVQPKLRRMVLTLLDAVISICEGPAPRVMFQTLQHLYISRCGFHGSLFTSEIAHCLLHLEELVIKYCPSIHRLVESSNKKIIFPRLENLTLEDLPELCYESATIDIECPSLGELDVEDCPKFLVSVSDIRTGPAFQAEEH